MARVLGWLCACAATVVLGSCIRMSEPLEYACESNGDCASGERCRNHYACVPEACSTDSDCSTGEGCIEGTCVVGNWCSSETAGPCMLYGCDVPTRTCKKSCDADDDCSVIAVCQQSECVFACQKESDCYGYLCFAGGCTNVCDTTADCAAGYGCSSDGQCLKSSAAQPGVTQPAAPTTDGDFGLRCASLSDCLLGLKCLDTGGGASLGTCGKTCTSAVECRGVPGAKREATCIRELDGDLTCRPFCTTDSDCSTAATSCVTTTDTSGTLARVCSN